MKVLSAETNLSSATNVSSASVVRIFNSDSSAATVTKKDSGGSTIGSFTISAGEVVYSEKDYTDTLEGGSGLKVSKVAYSHMMSYSSYTSSGGGGGGSSIITTNLVLHLNASNSSSYSGSGTTWTDLSGQGNNGTLENGVSYSSTDGGYLIFDGSNDFISFTDSNDFILGTGDFTYETWIQITGSGTFMRMGSFINDADTGASPNLTLKTNEIYMYSSLDSGFLLKKLITSSTSTWYHVVFTRVGTDIKLYRNGVLLDTVSNITTNFVDDRLVIGRNHVGTAFATGHIAQTRLYKGKGFTDSEVLQNYDATKSTYGY